MQIEILPPQLANQIAAGEVVERPSSVVKELVENSLDAGATEVEVHIEQGGAGLILIRDNGSGISKEDLPLALCRHATSKIKSMDDLLSILSFGFRGEALASISSVSRLTLTSKTEEQSEAWQVYAEGREMNAVIKPAAHPVGTSVEVRHLFYNTPARRKFLRTEKTEFNHIDEVMKRIALVRYDVAFILSHQGKKIRDYRVSKHQDPLTLRTERIGAVCGQRFLSHAKQISWTHFDLSIQAWIWPTLGTETDLHFTKGVQYCYVNGRVVRDKVLLHAIKQAFQSFYPDLSPSDDKLAYVIYFDLPPEQVDVNVHPAKHEVRFHQTRLIHDFIFQAVVESLSSQNQQLEFDRANKSNERHQMPTPKKILDTNRSAAGENQFASQEEVFQSDESKNNRIEATEEPLYKGERHLLAEENSKEEIIPNSAIFERKTQPFDVATYLEHTRKADSQAKAESLHKNQNWQSHSSFSKQANALYRSLVTPLADEEPLVVKKSQDEDISSEQMGFYYNTFGKALHVLEQQQLLLVRENGHKKEQVITLDLYQASIALKSQQLRHVISQKQSQALLLPLTLKLSDEEWKIYLDNQAIILQTMITCRMIDKNNTIEIEGVPAPLRHCDLAKLFAQLLQFLAQNSLKRPVGGGEEEQTDLISFLAHYLVEHTKEGSSRHWSLAQAIALVSEIELLNPGYQEIYHAEFVRELN